MSIILMPDKAGLAAKAKSKAINGCTIPDWVGFPTWHKTRSCRFEQSRPNPAGGKAQLMKDVDLMRKPVFVFGREPKMCDVVLDHPSLSRRHAVVLHHKVKGVYVMDLKSAHGTYMGKKRLPGGEPVQILEGQSIRFGGSSRLYTLLGSMPPFGVNTGRTVTITTKKQAVMEENEEVSGGIGPRRPKMKEGESAQRLDDIVESTFIPNRAALISAAQTDHTQTTKKSKKGGFNHLPPARLATLTPAARALYMTKLSNHEEAESRKIKIQQFKAMSAAGNTFATGFTINMKPLNEAATIKTAASVSSPSSSSASPAQSASKKRARDDNDDEDLEPPAGKASKVEDAGKKERKPLYGGEQAGKGVAPVPALVPKNDALSESLMRLRKSSSVDELN